jgi:hypothetical protein
VHRGPVSVGDGAEERSIACKPSDRHAGERTADDERSAIVAFERKGHETSVRAA